MDEILQYLKKNGEKLDMEIATATGISLANVRLHLEELATKGEIMTCHLIRHEKGKTIEGTSCRIAGYIPPAAPGRKSKAQLMGAAAAAAADKFNYYLLFIYQLNIIGSLDLLIWLQKD
jgi:hypothetical protein